MNSHYRPTGITILAILQAVGGIFNIMGGFTLIDILVSVPDINPSIPNINPTESGAPIIDIALIMGLVAVVVGIVSLVLSYGLWQLKPWAWMGTLMIQGITILLGVIQLAQGQLNNSIDVIAMAIAGAIIYYLLRPEIKAEFGK